MQVSIVVLLFISVCTVSAGKARTDFPQYIVLKSFPTALGECAQYFEISNCSLSRIVQTSFPNEREVKKLVRCTLINLHCWNDVSGIREPVMHFFFNPTPEDSCYLNRTRECIKKFELQPENKCDVETQAYNAFICYYRQYGNLNSTNQFLPLLPRELDQLVLTSFSLAKVSDDALLQFSQGNIVNNNEFPAVLLIIFIRGGFFHEVLLTDRLYIQFGNPELLIPQTEQCIEAAINALPCNSNSKELLYRIFKNCLQNVTDVLGLVQRLSKQLVGNNSTCSTGNFGSSTNSSSYYNTQAPCYNVNPR